MSKEQAAPEQAGPERGAEEAGRLHHTLARDHDTLGEYHPALHHGSQEVPCAVASKATTTPTP